MAEFGGDKKGRHCVTTIKASFTAVSACSQALVTVVIWLPTAPIQNRGGGTLDWKVVLASPGNVGALRHWKKKYPPRWRLHRNALKTKVGGLDGLDPT